MVYIRCLYNFTFLIHVFFLKKSWELRFVCLFYFIVIGVSIRFLVHYGVGHQRFSDVRELENLMQEEKSVASKSDSRDVKKSTGRFDVPSVSGNCSDCVANSSQNSSCASSRTSKFDF